MTRQIMTGMFVLAVILMVAGCSAAGITARSYVEKKPRVDQEMSEGNFGYICGKPVAENRQNYKKTRKMYVLEFTKEPEETADEPVVVTRTKTVYVESEPRPKPKAPSWAKPIVIPSFEEESRPVTRAPAAAAAPMSGFEEYTVQKNDTLQKISKKFYDTYRKWPQIYEVNKDKIKSPDKIKPGIVLQIPVE